MSDIWLVVGLGNPGERFANTRHNAGARAVARLAQGLGEKLSSPRSKLKPGKPTASVAEVNREGARLVLACPATFMNESGRAVTSLVRWYKASPGNLIVVHDEIDLGEGALRIQFGRGSGGHRGVNSIMRSIGTQDFYRVRIGVGRPPGSADQDPADYVLEQMSKAAADRLADTEAKASEAVLSLISDGLEPTMTKFNSR